MKAVHDDSLAKRRLARLYEDASHISEHVFRRRHIGGVALEQLAETLEQIVLREIGKLPTKRAGRPPRKQTKGDDTL